MKKYKVLWDNGASACGAFPCLFDTQEDANAYGEEWATESNIRDFGTPHPWRGFEVDDQESETGRSMCHEDGYSWDVVEVEGGDDDPDACEGSWHEQMRRENAR